MLRKYCKKTPVFIKINENNELIGKNAIITGGSSGIGYAIAEAYLSAGANVIITGNEEFKNRNMSEGEIVEFYYKMFLDREATEWDKAFWSERITTDDTTLLFYGVINSETFKNKCEAQGLDAGDYFIESGVFTEGIYENNPECGLDANGNYIFYATFGDSTYYHVVYNANATTLEYSEA